MKQFRLILLLTLVLISCKKEYPNLNVTVFGHGGESLFKSKSKFLPNTVESMERALELGADGVEIDVQLTMDGQLVAYHDLFLEENSEGNGCINNANWADLQLINIYNTSEKMDLLENVINVPMSQGKKVYLDLKHFNPCDSATVDVNLFNFALNEVLSNYTDQQRSQIIVNSRSDYLLNAITDSNVHKSFEYDDIDFATNKILDNNYEILTMRLDSANLNRVQNIQALGIKVCLFGIVSRKEVYKSLDLAPEFVISDNIECTIKATDG
ncbi:hypothetical protein K6119_03320 [Paracrocinitomix mangrovi]|uniref:glycerophosphodiester phosphodiesterase n=1 Tax=Paracrocinitomix mangrovi TaxID=2862509 RepID=UPI001C8D9F48|nr:glycerophosphodiester phosphodiesterase family protein [Paracrocinitomix mangrovi]UKN02545.1 hypothetical protein K6119_03320 [Paracrocinitomix mangrovi]